jgi:2-dehydropantoate 2-reductase
MGAGAVGCYFGGMLARAGAPVTLIGRANHVDAIRRDGLTLETLQFRQRVSVAASVDVVAARDANVVLLCVKALDTQTAAVALAPHLADGALVVSMQNGVDNVERIRAATGLSAIAAVVYVAAEMAAPGHVKHTGRGDLVIGTLPTHDARPGELEKLAATFGRGAVPCRVADNIESDLWVKLLMNCAYNAISALSRARYGRIVGTDLTREVMRNVATEVIAVARAAGVQLADGDLFAAVERLGKAMSGALSSTAQDIARGKRTEIDALNGYVARRGAELRIATPVNHALHALVKLLEETPS